MVTSDPFINSAVLSQARIRPYSFSFKRISFLHPARFGEFWSMCSVIFGAIPQVYTNFELVEVGMHSVVPCSQPKDDDLVLPV